MFDIWTISFFCPSATTLCYTQVVDNVRLQLVAAMDGSSSAIMAGNSWVANHEAHNIIQVNKFDIYEMIERSGRTAVYFAW